VSELREKFCFFNTKKRKTKNTSKTDKTPFARVGRHTIFCTIAFEE